MKGSVFFELALEAMKNKKNNWPFFTHLVYPFSSISRDILGLVRLKIIRGFLLCRLGSVNPFLQRVISHFGSSLLIESTDYDKQLLLLVLPTASEGHWYIE